MNAIQLLKSEHDTAKQAFAQIKTARAEQRGKLWTKLEPELKMHEQLEETALYGPVAQEVGSHDETLKAWQAQHQDEVAALDALIQELDGLEPADDEWLDKLGELQQTLAHHIEEEEGEVWPRIQRAWDASKLDQAGQQMEALKRQKKARAA